MDVRRLLITGGAGFVGSNLAVLFKRSRPHVHVTALDNLKRRGSELNVSRLAGHGVEFCHGDVRCAGDLASLGDFDLLIDCAAEPSVQAGLAGSPRDVIETNLAGTVNCMELARVRQAAFLFLSTSRVYPIAALNGLPFVDDDTRFRWDDTTGVTGFGPRGIDETFSLEGARSYYGASKLSCELLLQEYAASHGMKVMINRCGVLCGPWQMGKVDQGFVALWVARHVFARTLQYIGFGGLGKQVRDVLHIEDLFDLLLRQLELDSVWDGRVYNVGGGREVSLSLLELTRLCQDVTGRRTPITPVTQTSPVDVRIYLTDTGRVERDFSWRPRVGVDQIVADVHGWIQEQRGVLEPILG